MECLDLETQPTLLEHHRPRAFVCDIAKQYEDDGTGLHDPSGIIGLISPIDDGGEYTKNLSNFEVFRAAANAIPGASARISMREDHLPL